MYIGAILFSKPLSLLNMIGTSIAMFGVLAYSYAQQSSHTITITPPLQLTKIDHIL